MTIVPSYRYAQRNRLLVYRNVLAMRVISSMSRVLVGYR